MNILERIKELCSYKGLSITELEKLSNIARGTIGKWDKSIPGADKLQKVAKALGTTMEYLLTGKDKESNGKTLILAREANSLTDEQFEVVKNIIDEFKKKNNIG